MYEPLEICVQPTNSVLIIQRVRAVYTRLLDSVLPLADESAAVPSAGRGFNEQQLNRIKRPPRRCTAAVAAAIDSPISIQMLQLLLLHRNLKGLYYIASSSIDTNR